MNRTTSRDRTRIRRWTFSLTEPQLLALDQMLDFADADLQADQERFSDVAEAYQEGRAKIDPHAQGKVPGVIYRLTSEDLLALDRFEGFPMVYTRIPVVVVAPTGQRVPVQAYRLVRGRSIRILWPSAEYLSLIRLGYDDWGLPKRTIMRALARSGGVTLGEMGERLRVDS